MSGDAAEITRDSLMREVRARHPGLREALIADASVTAGYRGERAEFRSGLDAAIQVADQAQFETLQGYLLAVQGRKADARTAFNRAVSLYPGYQPAIRALAKIGS